MNDELVIHIKRHIVITEPNNGEKDKSICIDGRCRYLNSNKKRIKKRIFEFIENKFTYLVDEEEKKKKAMKTIKTYIDLIRKI